MTILKINHDYFDINNILMMYQFKQDDGKYGYKIVMKLINPETGLHITFNYNNMTINKLNKLTEEIHKGLLHIIHC